MRKMLVGAALAPICLLMLGNAIPARALRIAMPNTSARISQAKLIATGRVVAIADQDTKATTNPRSKQMVNYRIAIVRLSETIKGKTKEKMIRIGYIAPQQNNGGIGIRPIPIRPGFGRGRVNLRVGQEGLWFLTQHHSKKFYMLPSPYGYFIDGQNKQNLDREISTVRNTMKILNNIQGSLTSKNGDTRILAAKMLIEKYRTYQGSQKQVPISAKESQQILKILHDADWDYKKYQRGNYQMNPMSIIGRLGLNQKDGYVRPTRRPLTQQDYANSYKAWLAKNWKTYRIKRYVPGSGVRPGPIGRPVPGGPIRILPVRPPVQIQPGRPPIQIQPIRPIRGRPIQVQPGRPIQIQPLPAKRSDDN